MDLKIAWKNVLCTFMLMVIIIPALGTSEICTQKTCNFILKVNREQTMTYLYKNDVTFNVALNGSQLQVVENELNLEDQHLMIGHFVQPNDVITTDGYPRNVITINGQFPGPTLEVMEGAQVEVLVENELYTEAITIHWHGIHQLHTPWNDGVPFVTSCPILPLQSYVYRFTAKPAGTHWYHSHFFNQRLDGLFGMFIVHQSEPVLPYFVLSVMDWYHMTATALKVTDPFNAANRGPGDGYLVKEHQRYAHDGVALSSLAWVSGLINGRGRLDEDEPFPLAQFEVIHGKRYLFRVCHTGAEYAFELSVDNHRLDVIAMDGQSIEQITVDFLLIYPGECFDFATKTEADPGGKYWIRAQTLDAREDIGVKAIVQYNHNNSTDDPESEERICSAENPCISFNCPFSNYSGDMHRACISVADARSIEAAELVSDNTTLVQFYNFGFSIGSSVNSRQWVSPREPLIRMKMGPNMRNDTITKCPNNCSKGCKCTYIQDLPINRTVQMVFSSLQPNYSLITHHSIHMHGHNFAILKVGYPSYNHTTGQWNEPNPDITCGDDPLCMSPRWTNNNTPPDLNYDSPPNKDTVVVPARGYVVIQLRTTNPGYWLLHCHQELHLEEGMIMLFNVSADLIPPQPHNLPSCPLYDPTAENKTCPMMAKMMAKMTTPGASDADMSDMAMVKGSLIVLLSLGTVLLVIMVFIALCGCRKHTKRDDQYIYTPLKNQEEDLNLQCQHQGVTALQRCKMHRDVSVEDGPAVIEHEQSTFGKQNNVTEHGTSLKDRRMSL